MAKQPSLDAPASEWLVYADALQEARDARGELIVLNHAVESGKSPASDRDAYVAKHIETLIGSGATASAYRLTWRWCFIDRAEVVVGPDDPSIRFVEDLLASPAAANVRSIALVGVMAGSKRVDLQKAMTTLAEKLPKTCRSVSFIDDRATRVTMLVSRDFEPDPNLVQLGSLEPFWSIEALEEVHVSIADGHQLQLGVLNAPNLKSFTFHSLHYGPDPYSNDPTELSGQLAQAVWPKLETFDLRLSESFFANIVDDADAYVPSYSGDEDYEDRMDEAEEGENEGANWGELAGVINNLKKSPLKRLALTSADSAQSLLDTIASTGLPKTLEELDLSHCSISSVDWFLANKEIIAPLKRLILLQTAISDEDAKKLATLGPEIKHSQGATARYRYVVGSE